MSEHPETASGGRPSLRMCVRCHVNTDVPVVISVVHQNSGPGFNVYACVECARHFPEEPDVLSLPVVDRADGAQ
ncbi:hypothetical protein [Streptomyces sp. AC512_CC834]|uniref:hypothetical protein n=1 Tax=Streptomyces sp. AC512_CC834 TaxID=2823691 RepID=UPI001C27E109|nr:hypothetical protein [Streptomyces sp. AC512_CC834]